MKLLALFLAAAAQAAQTAQVGRLGPSVPSFQLSIPPVLAGSLAEPAHPLVPRINQHASGLVGRQISNEGYGNFLADLASESRPEADRLAAAAIARMLVEPGLVHGVLEARPELQRSPIAHLPFALVPSTPYRGFSAEDRRTLIHRLAEAARKVETVEALFEGSSRKASLPDSGVSGSKLIVGGQKARLLGWSASGTVFAHPDLQGVTVEVGDERWAADAKPFAESTAQDAMLAHMALEGRAPRTLGRDVVFAKGFGPTPMRTVAIREAVYGRRLTDILGDEPLTDAQRAQVMEALLLLLDRGALGAVKGEHIVIGQTMLRPESRAYLMGYTGPWLAENGQSKDQRRQRAAAWLTSLENQAVVWRNKARNGLAGFKF